MAEYIKPEKDRYIKLSQALEVLDSCACWWAHDRMECIPAADVRENVKSYWHVVVNYQNGTETVSCPNCQISDTFVIGPHVKVLFSRYCPNCGARMEGEQDAVN